MAKGVSLRGTCACSLSVGQSLDFAGFHEIGLIETLPYVFFPSLLEKQPLTMVNHKVVKKTMFERFLLSLERQR